MPISVFQPLSRPDFLAKVHLRSGPAVLKGQVAHWPMVGLGRQSDEALADYLRQHDNGHVVGVYVGPPDIGGHFFYGADTRSENFRFGPAPVTQVLDRLMKERTAGVPSSVYIQSAEIFRHLPGIKAENRLDLLPETVEPRIWIGNETVTRAHYDLTYNIACVAAGRRRVWLLPPEQLVNLYPGPFDRTIGGVPVSMVDVEHPDLELYPRFATARKTMEVVDLEPGDALYIPYGWWHQVRSLSRFNVMVNYWWDDAPPTPAAPYEALFHALLAIRDKPADQRIMWKALFDMYVFGSHGDPLAHLPPDEQGTLGQLTPDLINRIRQALRRSLD